MQATAHDALRTPEAVRTLNPGDQLQIQYDSSYSDGWTTIEATVGHIEERDTHDGYGAAIFRVYLDIGDDHHRERVHPSDDYHRRLKVSFIDEDDRFLYTLEGRNGGRWHSLHKGRDPRVEVIE